MIPPEDAATLDRINRLLAAAIGPNPFQTRRWGDRPRRFDSVAHFLRTAPFTTRTDWAQDQADHPPLGTNLTYPASRYTRFCQTSGTSGRPMQWLDTPESWDWMLENWQRILTRCGFTPADRILFAFSFGPFLGFWTAFEACARFGCRVMPGGGLGTAARLRLMRDHAVTALFCTPTYALHLTQAAREAGIAPESLGLRRILVAGEPGGSVPTTRAALEAAWPGALILDHHGMTEVGPVTYPCPDVPGTLRVLEDRYLAEVVDLGPDGTGELVLTTLGRDACPLIRYRTGDRVRPVREPGRDLGLAGGILGRVDDMLIIRGVNVFPSAVDAVVREFADITEYQARVTRHGAMAELALVVEGAGDPTRHALEKRLQDRLSLRVPVTLAPPGTLPRFELKARRWVTD